MADSKEIIDIYCIMENESYTRFDSLISRYSSTQKECFKLKRTNIDETPDFYNQNKVFVVDKEEKIPKSNFYYYKNCVLYFFSNDIADAELWISHVTLDGIILESSDATIISFLNQIISNAYYDDEDRFIKNLDEWLSTSGTWDRSRILTLSFGKMRHVYNELKKFSEYENLREKFTESKLSAATENLIDAIYTSDNLLNIKDRKSIIDDACIKLDSVADSLNRKNIRTISILLTGETGVGKSLLAEYLQTYLIKDSNTSGKKPEKLNCSQLSKEHLRNELFGAMMGTYTDQVQSIPGKLLENSSQVFILDEIGDLDLELQPHLLSFLDDSMVQPQNMARSVFCPLVFVGTTNRDIPRLIKQEKFRNDLYERFDLHLHIPPLRERRQEIKQFIKYMLASERSVREELFDDLNISKAFIAELVNRDYMDGNLRELYRNIRTAVRNCLSGGERTIKVKHLRNK